MEDNKSVVIGIVAGLGAFQVRYVHRPSYMYIVINPFLTCGIVHPYHLDMLFIISWAPCGCFQFYCVLHRDP